MVYGWRAMVGFIGPGAVAENTTYQFYQIVPKGVLHVVYPLGITELTLEEVEQALKRTDVAIRELARRHVDIIVLGGSPTVAVGGFGYDQKFIQRVAQLTSIPGTTSQTGALEAFRHLGIKRLAVATPFTDELNGLLKDFLEKNGFQVLAIRGLNIPLVQVAQQPIYVTYRLAKETFALAPQADGVYIPGASVPVVENIQLLEQDLKVPVVTSVQAMIWHVFRILRIGGPISGFGRLLQEL
mgnify:CR=1 FL=1